MTSFDDVFEAFFNKMEEDSDFFDYFDLTEEESMELAKTRALSYLKESIAVILRRCGVTAGTELIDVDYDLEEFNSTLDANQIDLLACLMYEQNYKRQYSKVKAFQTQFAPTTLQMFSPANDRKTLQETMNTIHEENMTMLDNYMSKEPGSYVNRVIDYDAYASEDDS